MQPQTPFLTMDDTASFSRPIVCGYCFGPKKMKTMNMVMAEASKARLTTTYAMMPPILPSLVVASDAANNAANASNNAANANNKNATEGGGLSASMPSPVMTTATCATPVSTPVATATGLTRAVLSSHEGAHQAPQDTAQTVTFSLSNNGQAMGGDGTDIRNIVRHFRSSCSSVGETDSVDTGTCTASTAASSHVTAASKGASTSTTRQANASTTANTVVSLSSASSSNHKSTNRQQQQQQQQQRYPVRISFVPLDPDYPLDQQHNGKMDIILHKLTEDILCLSQLAVEHKSSSLMSMSTSTFVNPNATAGARTAAASTTAPLLSPSADWTQSITNPEHAAAVQRVHRLVQFQADHPECCLVDNPTAVQTLMSRADIADTLAACLQNVSTASGMPCRSPKYAAVNYSSSSNDNSSNDNSDNSNFLATVRRQIREADLSFPMIVKPLTAAGSTASHAMAVLLDETALEDCLRSKTPCLCQEYANHDAALYKVYVLGQNVSVHKRRSLPNLPAPSNARSSRYSFIEFDSQRPYPRLTDFGYSSTGVDAAVAAGGGGGGGGRFPKRRRSETAAAGTAAATCAIPSKQLQVTAEEVMPVVQALKQAFGLELFGFDVLITSKKEIDPSSDCGTDGEQQHQHQRMLVVDVNYFPSYKEVANFPAQLAKYLTDRAMESRRNG